MNSSWQPLTSDPRIHTYNYSFGGGRANAVAIPLGGGRLAVISAPCRVPDSAYTELERHGEIAALVAPNGYHNLGLPAWHARYPKARLFGPREAVARIAKKHPSLPPLEPIERFAELAGTDVWLGVPDGSRHGDLVARVHGPSGWTWYFTDLVMNMPALPKNPVFKLLLRLTKSGPGFKVNRLLARYFLKDRKAAKRWLAAELAAHAPVAVVLGHGAPITDPASAGELATMVEEAL